jgi:hypothetical protein
MLTFESPFYEIKGVVVLRDHAVPTMFHYLAGPPRLTRSDDGRPNLLLLKYRHALDAMASTTPLVREQLGGGFLLFGVDCGLSEEVKEEIIRELQSRVPPDAGPISLVPVLYTKGTVNVIALDAQRPAAAAPTDDPETHSTFVRGILGVATPSLLQDQRAIFSLALSPDGVALLEDAYQSELSPIGVMYELEFSGLRPAIAIKATVDKKRVYEQLKLGLHIGVGSVSGDGSTPAEGQPAQPTPPGQPATPPATPPAAPPVAGQPTPPAPPGQQPAPPPRPTTPGQPSTPPGQPTMPGERSTPPAQPGAPAQPKSRTEVAVSADLSYAVEKLKQSGAITIEIVRQQEGKSVEEMEKTAMTLLKESILNEFFKPAMSNVPSPSAATNAASALAAANQVMATTPETNRGKAGAGTKVEVGFQLQMKREEELQTAVFDYSVVAPETRTHAPNGFFSALIGATEKAEHIREIDLDDEFFKILDVEVSTTADFGALDLKSIVVELQYGGTIEAPRVTGSATFLPDAVKPRRFQAFRDLDDFSYRYRVSYKFGQAERIAAQRQDYQTPWRTTTSRALVVHPPDDVAMLRVFLEPGIVDWDVVDRVETHLAYADPGNRFRAERTYLLDASSTRQEWLVRLSNPAHHAYDVRHVWHLKDHSEVPGPVETRRGAPLFVGDPFVDRLPIVIHPQVDPASVLRVEVELHYEDVANRFEVRKNIELSGPGFKQTPVSIPIMDSSQRQYTYRVILIKANGGAENQHPRRTDQLSIIVTEGGIYLDVDVRVFGNMTQSQVDALQVDLRSEPLDGERHRVESLLFEPGAPPKAVQRLLLRADRPQQFEYRTTLFTAEREPIESDWTVHEKEILPLQLSRLLAAA